MSQPDKTHGVLTDAEVDAILNQPGMHMSRLPWAIEAAVLAKVAPQSPVAPAENRECNNEECGWSGQTDRMCGSVGPLCPDCGETTEPVAPAGASTMTQICDALDDAHELGGPAHERIKRLIEQRDEARARLADAPTVSATDAKEAIHCAIGFGFEPGELQTVNASDLLEVYELGRNAAPTVSATDGLAALIVRSACESDPADPDDPDTIKIKAADLLAIVESHAAPTPPTSAADAELLESHRQGYRLGLSQRTSIDALDAARWRKAITQWKVFHVETFSPPDRTIRIRNDDGIPWCTLTDQIDAAIAATKS